LIELKRVLSGFTVVILLAALFLIISSGCSPKEIVKNKPEEETLRERVMAYWDSMVKEDYGKIYEIEYPLFRKETTRSKYINYMSNPMIRYNSYEITRIKMKDAGLAEVNEKVNVTLKPFGAKALTIDREVSEKWMLVGGHWYHVPGRFARSQK
jgi:hypothetical protein